MIINHNISALNAHRHLIENTHDAGRTMEKLSSGLRINRGADDAAGLAVSEKMRTQVRGLNVAYRNAQDGISLMQTAEGYLQETTAALQRMRELTIQAANGIYTDADRSFIQKEIGLLTNEVERIAQQAEFNRKSLFLGNLAPLGTPAAGTAGTEGAFSNREPENPETGGLPLHIGPNMDQRVVVSINNMTAGALGIAESGAPNEAGSPAVNTKILVDSAESANKSIAVLDNALDRVTEERTALGAFQNRLEIAMRGISVAAENIQASESRIRDADMAKEMIDFVKLNILSQSATSMLTQANLQPQLVLRVLG